MLNPDRLPLRPPPSGVTRLSVVPKSRKVIQTSIRIDPDIAERLKTAAKILSDEAKAEGYEPFTRDDLIEHACKRWLEEWEEERAAKRRR